jgi:hypothetical protein
MTAQREGRQARLVGAAVADVGAVADASTWWRRGSSRVPVAFPAVNEEMFSKADDTDSLVQRGGFPTRCDSGLFMSAHWPF